ncbi:hypothetical protein ABI59_01125 [Acidobacteria bacterium Mor1]|nr:hypothetical protein ABI59_01125 [Acidobacteria bacterium Mor1]
MRIQALIRGFVVLGLLVSPAAFAEEIIYFTNGTTMAIKDHTVDEEKDVIQVDLGSNGFIAFPRSRVERIERAGSNVYLSPSYQTEAPVVRRAAGGSNFSLGSSGGGAAPVSGGASSSRRGASQADRQRQWDSMLGQSGLSRVGSDLRGNAVQYKEGNNPNRSIRRMGATAGAVGRSDMLGAARRGQGNVVQTASSNDPRNRVSNPITNLQFKGSASPGEPPASSGDAGSGSTGGGESSGGSSSGGSSGGDS